MIISTYTPPVIVEQRGPTGIEAIAFLALLAAAWFYVNKRL